MPANEYTSNSVMVLLNWTAPGSSRTGCACCALMTSRFESEGLVAGHAETGVDSNGLAVEIRVGYCGEDEGGVLLWPARPLRERDVVDQHLSGGGWDQL